MKRSLTIGCVLLVGGGVTNCGGSAEIGSQSGEEQGQHAGVSGSGAAAGFMGTIGIGGYGPGPYMGVQMSPAGAGGVIGYVGTVYMGIAGAPDIVGAGAGGWDSVGVGPEPIAGEGGESGSGGAPPVVGDVVPGVGTAPQGGSGGWGNIPPPP
jgi:hypothetical protein